MQEEHTKEHKAVKTKKTVVDKSKLTPPQRNLLKLAKEQGVPMARILEDLIPDLCLTPKQADQFGKTLQQIRAESRKETSDLSK